MNIARMLFLLASATSACAVADDRLSLKIHYDHQMPSMVKLALWNKTGKDIEITVPVEGSGSCSRYFSVEVEARGKETEDSAGYATGFSPFVVRLRPAGVYVHFILPGNYPGGEEMENIKRLRVTYTDPATKEKVRSNWLDIPPRIRRR